MFRVECVHGFDFSCVLNVCYQHSFVDFLINGTILLTICFHGVIFEEFVDCSVMEKDSFADIQLDKAVLSEKSLQKDMDQNRKPKKFKFQCRYNFPAMHFLSFQWI